MDHPVPVLVPDALEHVFKCVSSKQLLEFRGEVANVWNDVAKLVLKKRHDVGITLGADSSHDEQFLEFILKNPDGFTPPFVTIKNGNNSEDCQKTVLEICRILGNRGTIRKLEMDIPEEQNPAFNSGYLLKILGYLSTSLETLIFGGNAPTNSIFEFASDSEYSAAVEEFNKKTPLKKLKQLKFEVALQGNCPSELPRFLTLILKSAFSLRSFPVTLGFLGLDPIQILSEVGLLSQISEFAVFNAPSLETVLSASKKKLQAEKIHFMNVNNSLENPDPQKVAAILKSTENLQTLILLLELPSTVPHWDFPKLLKLQQLEMGLRNAVNINFSRDTPNLKYLMIHAITCTSSEEYETDWKSALNYQENVIPDPCHSLQHLTIGRGAAEDPECCKYLGKVFPSVKLIYLRKPSKEFIQTLDSTWEKLSLSIDHEGDLDEILFGLTKEWKATIDTGEKGWWKNVTLPENGEKNLKDFKNFPRRLHLQSMCKNLTDFSIYFGFARMPNLESLQIYPETKVTQEAKHYFRELFPHMSDPFCELYSAAEKE